MGNFWENSELKREDVEKNIADINQITKSLIYMSRYKIHLKFELDDVPIQKMNRKIIKVKIYIKHKSLYILILNFLNKKFIS